MRRSPCRAPSGRVVDVGEELLYALDFTFLQGTFLQGEVSLPRRGRKPEGLLVRARGTYIARAPELRSGTLAIFAPPTGLEPVTLRLTVECSAN